jgi:hypothetical protein
VQEMILHELPELGLEVLVVATPWGKVVNQVVICRVVGREEE